MKSSIAPALLASDATVTGRCVRAFARAPSTIADPATRHRSAMIGTTVALLLLLSALFSSANTQAQSASGSPATQTPERSDALASSTALAQARRLREEGDAAGALKTIETALGRLPRDVALRFTRAVMQADLGQTEAALAGFTALTQEYPELPEPYNNLATLHAARGDLDRARAALDEAVRAMPVYALAWENLGDVHLRLAERAWQQASQLDKASEASAKLKLARDLITRISPPAAPAPSGARRP